MSDHLPVTMDLDFLALLDARIAERPSLRSLVLASAASSSMLGVVDGRRSPATDVGHLLAGGRSIADARAHVLSMLSHLDAIEHEDSGA